MPQAILLLFLFLPLLVTAQSGRLDVFLPGTQLTYYENACGTTIPQAAGTNSWCPYFSSGPLGVVTQSQGLSGHRVDAVLPNYYNDSEVFATSGGLSIRHANGSYENLPFEATPLDYNPAYPPKIIGGWVRPDGKVIFIMTPKDYYWESEVFLYDLVTKELTYATLRDRVSNEHFIPRYLAGDPASSTTYLASSHDNFSFSRENIFSLYYPSDEAYNTDYDLPDYTIGQYYKPTGAMVVRNKTMYIGTDYGVSAYDIYGKQVANYASNFGFRYNVHILELAFASDGYLWMAAQYQGDARLVRLNVADSTYQTFSASVPGTSTPLLFTDIEILGNGDVTAIAENYDGIIDLHWQGTNPVWTFHSRAALNQHVSPITHQPISIDGHQGSIYYTMDNASALRDRGIEVIRRSGHQWFSLNDDTPSNHSYADLRRIDQLENDGHGGVYWVNTEDHVIGRMDGAGSVQRLDSWRLYDSPPTVYADGQLAYVEPGLWRPNWVSTNLSASQYLPKDIGANELASQYGRALTFFNPQTGLYRRYVDGTLVGKHQLDPAINYTNYSKFTTDRNGDAWLIEPSEAGYYQFWNNVRLIHFDLKTNTTTSRTIPYIGGIRDLLPAPVGGVYVVGSRGAVHASGPATKAYTATDHSSMTNIISAAVDGRGSLHLLRSDRRVLRLDDLPTAPSLTRMWAYEQYDQFSVEPWSDIAVDANGDTWISAANRLLRFSGYASDPGYRNTSEKFSVSGYVYTDRNNNNQPDSYEGIAKQPVQLTIGKTVYLTQTDATGRYAFELSRANSIYYLATSSGISSSAMQGTVQIYDTHRHYDGPDFRYASKYRRHFGKQTDTEAVESPDGTEAVDIAVFPNPATDFVTVTGSELLNRVQLLNGNGQTVLEIEPLVLSVQLPVARLPPGIYLLLVHAAGETQTHKILLR